MTSPSKECVTCGKNNSVGFWCTNCEHQRFRDNFQNWTSENDLIDDLIRNVQLSSSCSEEYIEWIPFSDLEFVKYHGRGRHSTIYTASWLRGPLRTFDELSEDYVRSGPRKVVLKSLDNSRNINPQYCYMLRECICQKYENDYELCYGLTRDPIYKDYMLVMDYSENGNLYDYIKEKDRFVLDWIKIIEDCCELSRILDSLHSRNLVHGNLHGGNVLSTVEGFTISDMGLGHPADEIPFMKIYGVLPFVAPEVIRGERYTPSADIYSFGIIMWMLSSIQLPFADRSHDLELAKDIINGLRPTIEICMPELFLDLMTRCWNENIEVRPTSNELVKLLTEWKYALQNFDYYAMEDYNHLIISQVDEVDDVYMDTNIIRSHNIHENAIYTSQLIDFCSLRRINHLNESPIDALLKRHLIDIIPYEQFSEIQLISHGGYSSMYSAFWKERGIKVAMKMFRDVFNLDFGFLSSLNSCLNLRNYEIGSEYYGITKDPISHNYVILMQYFEAGNLYNQTFLNWRGKILSLLKISLKLKEIHGLGLIHKNLHGGNLLPIYNNNGNEYEWFITDTGITKSNCYKLYGVLPFMAPEVLIHNNFTQSSDIYSLSMIMYIILTGFKPFNNKVHNIKLATNIVLNQKRPDIFSISLDNIPNDYLKLLKQCWSHNPINRPNINQIIDILEDWITQLDHRSCTRITEQFVKCEKSGFTDPANFYICEDDDSYYSRNFTDWKKDLCFY
ncbi:kinase-like protein [Rhizophagus irregularis]|uniref:Kinase-like protein n=1 Tax=Rhizophagus irregularis TaxID=588596 RepID=A0A2N1N153_9GLOM|nr:kinase-like protein [Rhizophagus irregularis]